MPSDLRSAVRKDVGCADRDIPEVLPVFFPPVARKWFRAQRSHH
jgi:hypothetical protein